MNEDELHDGLQYAGLSKYQIQAYTTLLELGTATATNLAEEADVPRSRIYDVLRDLEEEEYVETFEQDTLRVRARDPAEVFTRLQNRARLLNDTAEEIRERWQHASVSGHRISVLKRADTAIERAETAIADAENQIQLCVTPDQFEQLRPVLVNAVNRGVFVLISITTSPNMPVDPPSETKLDGAVTEVRHRSLPAPFLALVDREITCFAPHTRSIGQYGTIFEDEMLTYVFHWYFQAALWESWPILYTTRDDGLPAEYVDIRECIRDVAPLFTEGATITARVHGKVLDRQQTVTLHGTIVDIRSVNGFDTASSGVPTLSSLAGQATFILEADDDERYGIGGWGAVIEDIEALRIVIEDVQSSGDAQ